MNEVLAEVLYDEDVQSQKNRISLLKGDQLLMSASGGIKLPDNVVFSDEQGTKTSLKEVVGGRRKFVFRYSHLNCNVCIDAAVLLVKALTEEIGAENVVYIATYSNGRDLTVFRRLNQLHTKVYNVESLPMAPDRANVPYCFVIEPDNTVSHLFIPRKEMLPHAEDYFEQMKSVFN